MIAHTINTLKIKDYILFDETDNIKYLCRIKILSRFSSSSLTKLKNQIVAKFSMTNQDLEDEYNEKKLYFYYKIIYFKSMYYALKERHVHELIDAFKIEFGLDFDIKGLKLIKGKAEYFEGKYKTLVENYNKKKESGGNLDWTLMDEISQIEAILGINIDRNQPIFALMAYRKRVKDKIKALGNGKGH